MNNMIFFGFLLLSVVAQASSTVCSSEKLFYSNVHFDFGTQPPEGTVTGKVVVVYDGKILLDHSAVEGVQPAEPAAFEVSFYGARISLEKTGNQSSGSEVYKQSATLVRKGLHSGPIPFLAGKM